MLHSVDIALDLGRKEVLVVAARLPVEDSHHLLSGDVVPALAVASGWRTVRESFAEILSVIKPARSPISVSASLAVLRIPKLNVCTPILVRLVDTTDRVGVAGVENKELAQVEVPGSTSATAARRFSVGDGGGQLLGRAGVVLAMAHADMFRSGHAWVPAVQCLVL